MSFQELVTYFPPSLYFHPLESSTQVPFSLDTPKYFAIPVASATPSFFLTRLHYSDMYLHRLYSLQMHVLL